MRRNMYPYPLVIAILILQIIPLLLFPAKSFSPATQEWWLPVLLVVMVLIADFQVIVRRTTSSTPWYLLSFAQGFNIISRLMMIWPNITQTTEQGTVANWNYVLLTLVAIALSAALLVFFEKPAVRVSLLRA
ncbi:MAG: hypothetical protein ACUVR4_02580 [Anaerolineae bacterium]